MKTGFQKELCLHKTSKDSNVSDSNELSDSDSDDDSEEEKDSVDKNDDHDAVENESCQPGHGLEQPITDVWLDSRRKENLLRHALG